MNRKTIAPIVALMMLPMKSGLIRMPSRGRIAPATTAPRRPTARLPKRPPRPPRMTCASQPAIRPTTIHAMMPMVLSPSALSLPGLSRQPRSGWHGRARLSEMAGANSAMTQKLLCVLRRQTISRRRIGNRQLFLAHIGANVAEQRRRQVAFAGVRQHAEDSRARACLFRHLERAGEGRAGRDADEDAFLLRQRLRALHRVRTGDGEHAVDAFGVDRLAGDARNEIRRPALHRMWLERGMRFRRCAVLIAQLRFAR